MVILRPFNYIKTNIKVEIILYGVRIKSLSWLNKFLFSFSLVEVPWYMRTYFRGSVLIKKFGKLCGKYLLFVRNKEFFFLAIQI